MRTTNMILRANKEKKILLNCFDNTFACIYWNTLENESFVVERTEINRTKCTSAQIPSMIDILSSNVECSK